MPVFRSTFYQRRAAEKAGKEWKDPYRSRIKDQVISKETLDIVNKQTELNTSVTEIEAKNVSNNEPEIVIDISNKITLDTSYSPVAPTRTIQDEVFEKLVDRYRGSGMFIEACDAENTEFRERAIASISPSYYPSILSQIIGNDHRGIYLTYNGGFKVCAWYESNGKYYAFVRDMGGNEDLSASDNDKDSLSLVEFEKDRYAQQYVITGMVAHYSAEYLEGYNMDEVILTMFSQQVKAPLDDNSTIYFFNFNGARNVSFTIPNFISYDSLSKSVI